MIKLSIKKYLNLLLIATPLIIIHVISVAGCKGKTSKIINKDKLYGKVKSKIECSYYTKKHLWRIVKSDTFYEKTVSLYDEKGNKIEETAYNATFNTNYKCIYKYDEKGNQIESGTLNPDGTVSNKFFKKYDHINNTMMSYGENSLDKSYFKFDSRGYAIEENIHRGGRLDSRTTWKYDGFGNMKESNTYDVDGNRVDRYICIYDEESNPIESKRFDANGTLFSTYTADYDDYGNPLNENTSYHEFIKAKYPENKKANYQRSCQYDYDDQNNWIKKVEAYGYGNPEGYTIVERTIEYYK